MNSYTLYKFRLYQNQLIFIYSPLIVVVAFSFAQICLQLVAICNVLKRRREKKQQQHTSIQNSCLFLYLCSLLLSMYKFSSLNALSYVRKTKAKTTNKEDQDIDQRSFIPFTLIRLACCSCRSPCVCVFFSLFSNRARAHFSFSFLLFYIFSLLLHHLFIVCYNVVGAVVFVVEAYICQVNAITIK